MARTWIGERVTAGFKPNEIAVFVRTGEHLDRARAAVQAAGLAAHELDEHVEPAHGSVSLGTIGVGRPDLTRSCPGRACAGLSRCSFTRGANVDDYTLLAYDGLSVEFIEATLFTRLLPEYLTDDEYAQSARPYLRWRR